MSGPSEEPLPPPRRVVTGHNDAGQATVKKDAPLELQSIEHGHRLGVLWSTTESPADVNSPEDKATKPPGMRQNGSLSTFCDLPPKASGKLHRTMTLDYVVVIKGSVTMELDDGSKVVLNEGDFVVQQATMHNWINESDQWARILGIMLPSEAPIVNGKELEAVWPFEH